MVSKLPGVVASEEAEETYVEDFHSDDDGLSAARVGDIKGVKKTSIDEPGGHADAEGRRARTRAIRLSPDITSSSSSSSSSSECQDVCKDVQNAASHGSDDSVAIDHPLLDQDSLKPDVLSAVYGPVIVEGTDTPPQLLRVAEFFAKIDRMIAYREPGLAFIFGDQLDLKDFRQRCCDKVLEIARAVLRQARASHLESKFASCMEKFKAEERQVIETHLDRLSGIPMTLSSVMKQGQQACYFPATLLKEARMLFQLIKACDDKLFQDKAQIFEEYLRLVYNLAVEQKARSVERQVTEMLEQFKRHAESKMDDDCAGIASGRLKLKDELCKMIPQYRLVWNFLREKKEFDQVQEVERALREHETKTLDHLQQCAALELKKHDAEARSLEEQFSACLLKLEQKSSSFSEAECEFLSQKPFSIEEIGGLKDAGLSRELVDEPMSLLRQIKRKDHLLAEPIFRTCENRLSGTLYHLYNKSVDAHGGFLAASIERELHSFFTTISDDMSTWAAAISDGGLDLESKLRADKPKHASAWKQLIHHRENRCLSVLVQL